MSHGIVTAILLVAAATCAAPPPAEQMAAIEDFTRAVSTGSPRELARVIAAGWAGADTSEAIRQRTLSQLGVDHWKCRGWRLTTSSALDAHSAYALAENALSQETDSLVFAFDPAGKVRALDVWTGVRVPFLARDTTTDAARVRALHAYVDRFRKAGVFSGAILVQRHGRVLFADSVGTEQRGGTRANGLDSRINIASIGKLFTSTAILQLVARGALSLDDSLDGFYPDSALAGPVRAVRIRHLLAHTSGIHDERAIVTPPGTQYFYSNLGYVLLGEVLERVSGERFEDYFAEHLFRPAAMSHTARPVLSKPVDYLAMGYVPQFGDSGFALVANPLLHTLPGNPAGALFSSARDLARFGEALRSGMILLPALVDSMRTPRSGTPTRPYGFGVMLRRGVRIWGHPGDLPGTDADLEIFEPSGVVSVVLANVSGVNNPIRRRIARLWGLVAR